MKYISRWAALLLAVMMTITSAGAELSLDGLTQEHLEALYQTASDAEIHSADALGTTAELWSKDTQAWADSGYALQWYVMDDAGVITALNGQNTASLDITYTLAPQRFVCIATDSTGKEYISPAFVAQAQTTNMEDYLNYLYEPEFWNEDDTPNTRAIYDHLNTVWNVDADGVNLAQSVVAAWWAEHLEPWFDYQLLCSCVITGAVEADFCMLHPYAEHVGTCGWYTTVDVVEDETTGITVSGDLPVGVSLSVAAATGPMPEIDTSHVDITATSPMVRSYNITLLDENGNEYIVPEGTTVQVTIPNVWSAWMSNPIVDVYHVTDDGEVIYLTSTKGEVVLLDDYSICFETDGFSDFTVMVGEKEYSRVVDGDTIKLAPGASIKLGSYSGACSAIEISPAEVVGLSAAMDENRDYFVLSATEDAVVGTTAAATLTFSDASTMTVSVEVVQKDKLDANEINKTFNIGVGALRIYNGNQGGTYIQLNMAKDTSYLIQQYGAADVTVTNWTGGDISAGVQNGTLYVTVGSNAEIGDSAKVTVKAENSDVIKMILYVDVVEEAWPERFDNNAEVLIGWKVTTGYFERGKVARYKMAPDTTAILPCEDNPVLIKSDSSAIVCSTTATDKAYITIAGTAAPTPENQPIKVLIMDGANKMVVGVVFIDVVAATNNVDYTYTYTANSTNLNETYTHQYDLHNVKTYKYNLAPGLSASAKGYSNVEFTVADANVATATLEDGVLKVTAATDAAVGATTKVVVKDATTKAVVTTIFVEIVEKYVTIAENYTVDSSSVNKETYAYAGASDNDKAYKYYLAPGLSAIARGYGDAVITVADETVATATLVDGVLTVTAAPDATKGESTKVIVKDAANNAVLTTVFVEIVDRRIVVEEYTIDRSAANRETYTYDVNNDNAYKYYLAPGMEAISRRYEGAVCTSDNTAVATAVLSEDGVLTVTAAPGAQKGDTATVTVKAADSDTVLTTISVEIVEMQFSIIETYTIDRNNLNKETYTYSGASESGYAYKYNLAAEMQAIAKGYSSDVTVTVDNQNLVEATLSEDGKLTVTAKQNATPGQTAKVTVTDQQTGAILTTILVEIVQSPVAKLNSTDYKVQIAIRNDGTLVNEPREWDGGDYTYFTESYEASTATGIFFKDKASTIIDAKIFDHELFYFVSRDGTQTIGMVDPTGEHIKGIIIPDSIDWGKILTNAANERSITANDGETVTPENVHRYKLVPYVVKCQEGTIESGKGWHIDCAIVPKDVVHLSYDLDIPAGMTIDTAITPPDNQVGTAPATFTIADIGGMLTGTDADGEYKYIMVSTNYTFRFEGWNTMEDATGDWYYPNGSNTITIEEDTILYAIWYITPELGTGGLRVHKNVEDKAAGEFTFTINIPVDEKNANKTYPYTIYDANQVAISGGNGVISNGGTFTLSHGQYVLITGLPIASLASNGTTYIPNVTVTETPSNGYTPSWSDGTAGESVSVAIRDGAISDITCTNSKPTATTTTLTVKKENMRAGESAIIKVEVDGKTYMLSLSNTHDSDTIVNLPVGANYTVTEVNAWTWQYAENAQPVTGNTVAGGSTVTITNTQKTGNWMHDESSIINNLDGTTVEEIQTPINNQ